ncbi:hypothetical protein [Pedobacter sp. NJ-S-72]
MKISTKDQFNLDSSFRGLGLLTVQLYDDIYEYMYHFTFKKVMKSYANDFNDPWKQYIDEVEFFETIEDPFVQNCIRTEGKLMTFKFKLISRFGVDDEEESKTAILQAERFKPYILRYKHSKSYKKLRLYYERTIVETIDCLYLYACAITAQSNKIPLVFKRQFKLPEPECMKLLNHDDENVELLMELIVELKKDLNEIRLLIMKK